MTLFGFVMAVSAATGFFGDWQLTMEDDSKISAADLKVAPRVLESSCGGREFVWKSPDLDVTVMETKVDAVRSDARITVVNRGVAAVTACEFPRRMRFSPDEVRRFVYPGRGNFGVGMAFNAKFFRHTGNPKRPYLSYRVKYPTLFADFAFLEKTSGETVAVYGLQPRTGVEPWRNGTPFNPGETAVGGGAEGGWYSHSFALWAKCGARWTSPRVRLASGLTLEAALADYTTGNALARPLSEKVKDTSRLEALKRAPLVLVGGHAKARDLPRFGEKMPVPTVFHVTSYLHGGFDKQYPDHLPPRKEFGAQAEFAAAVKALQGQGHLVCPYTNPTWWCDDPPGPTFAKWGKGALSIDRRGEYRHEVYGVRNGGWQQCYFHPGSHEGNRRTVRQFTEEIPVDLLFEDQVGGRDWIWDFNPRSPSPTAHSEGMLSMAEEHSRRVPIACEDGWDHVAENETALMGCTWKLVPLTRSASSLSLFKEDFPPDTWTIEPVSLRLFHDKCLFYMHDLGSFVYSDCEVAWMLALGFQMSWKIEIPENYSGMTAEWYEYIHTLQREIVSQIAGQPLKEFRHDRAGSGSRRGDDGTVVAQYGSVRVCANLGGVPRTVEGHRLAPYGYWVETPTATACWLEGEGARIVSNGRIWRRKPSPIGGAPVPPPTKAGARKTGVVWLGKDAPAFAATVSGDEWLAALPGSVRIASGEELAKALAEGPGEWAAILNAHGECVPEPAAGRGLETVRAILRYVRSGGHWFETAGAPLNTAIWKDGNGVWRKDGLHGGALTELRIGLKPWVDPIPVRGTHALRPGAAGTWLPESVRALMREPRHRLNRGVGGGFGNGVMSVAETSRGECWFGATREGGRGAFWRIGTISPDSALSKAIVAATLAHLRETKLPDVPDIVDYHFSETTGKEK